MPIHYSINFKRKTIPYALILWCKMFAMVPTFPRGRQDVYRRNGGPLRQVHMDTRTTKLNLNPSMKIFVYTLNHDDII